MPVGLGPGRRGAPAGGCPLAEEEAGAALAAVFVLTSAVTGATVLRAAARVFRGAGRQPRERPGEAETTGEGEEPEVRPGQGRLPWPMVAVPAVLLGLCLLVGGVPAVAESLAHGGALFTDRSGYAAAVAGIPAAGAGAARPPHAGWTAEGIGLGAVSTLPACLLAWCALYGRAAPGWLLRSAARGVMQLRRLHSGLVGDYLAWLAMGAAALLVALALQT
ncbi:hypothetical protein ACGFYQ_12600 [Streptomyces sp. NPDC048258]|uniref:hypothetical protein n=1 Tax=Streptomyces sp. NPDC048258 TaxID=3365527 RepID=UPI0037111AE0